MVLIYQKVNTIILDKYKKKKKPRLNFIFKMWCSKKKTCEQVWKGWTYERQVKGLMKRSYNEQLWELELFSSEKRMPMETLLLLTIT